jgi:hypothetical protein
MTGMKPKPFASATTTHPPSKSFSANGAREEKPASARSGKTMPEYPPTLDLLRKSGEFFVMKEDLDDQTEAANEGI